MSKTQNHKPLFDEICKIIEQGKHKVTAQVNSTLTITYWHIGKTINQDVLQNKRAKYGKQVIKNIANDLMLVYGKSFAARNLRRMM